MLRRISTPQQLTRQEVQQIITPSLLGIAILYGLVIGYAFTDSFSFDREQRAWTIGLGLFGFGYALAVLVWRKYVPPENPRIKWPLIVINAAISVVTLTLLPASMSIFLGVIFMLTVTIKSILWERLAAYAYMLLILVEYGLIMWGLDRPSIHPNLWAMAILTIVIVELIQSMSQVNTDRTRRLQIINDFARQISSTLEQEQMLSIVGAAIQKAIRADTYFLGLATQDGQLRLLLLYDDDKYFPPTELSLEGTFSSRVIHNQQSLYIPDLQHEVNPTGLKGILTGNNRYNACWMGVPMKVGSITGILTVASYTPNAFDSTALELLENLAQHTALALDNANHHGEVKARSRLDSLTEVYNHGYIVHILQQELEKACKDQTPLSLIMLDVDHFKQYNDAYGHQTGDEVLIKLVQAIKKHIKCTDSVGRWGGEEFMIVLPNANGMQATCIARRLQKTLRAETLHPQGKESLPFPTISQGIAVGPEEASQIEHLIQLADQRLYVAKNRGRDQIEPEEEYWELHNDEA